MAEQNVHIKVVLYFEKILTFFVSEFNPLSPTDHGLAILLPDSRWAPRLKVGTFYYGCFQKYRENYLHLEVSVVNN